MSSDIVLSSALRSNLLSLQNTQRQIYTTQLRLATGLRVNSALDNPQNFFAAQSLNNRASDLNRLLDGISQSIRTIEEADNGITGLTRLVEQADAIAIEAQAEIRAAEGFARIRGDQDLTGLNIQSDTGGVIVDGASDTFTITIREADGTTTALAADIDIGTADTIESIVAAINTDANLGVNAAGGTQLVQASVTSGGQLQIESLAEDAVLRVSQGAANGLTAAGFAALGLDTVVGAEAVETGAATTRQSGTAVAGRILESAQAANTAASGQFEASQLLSDAGANDAGFIAAGDTVNFRVVVDGQSSANITVADTDTIQDLIDGINNDSVVGDDVVARLNTDTGRIEIESNDNVGTVELQIESTAAGDVTNFGFGTGASDLTAASVITADNSERFTFVGTSADLDQFEDDFNNVREQIDDLVEDASYRGVNLLAGDNLTTFFNEDRDNSLVTEGVDFTALGLGIAEGDFTTSQTIQVSLDSIRTALNEVRSFGQSIANDLSIIQTRRDFTEETINTLEAGADDLTVADQNEEGANLLALQTRQQLGVTSLSLASQSQQSVLRLF